MNKTLSSPGQIVEIPYRDPSASPHSNIESPGLSEGKKKQIEIRNMIKGLKKL